MSLKTPIAFCIFNRPLHAQKVFESIRSAQPRELFVIADGPREIAGEAELVRLSRAVINQVDWDCEVTTNFSEQNLGCKNRMATGLNWAFAQAKELIILEDDCLPNPTFFTYCEQLLERYRDDDQVMMISGNNFQPKPHSKNSYYFSRWPHIWGWASWHSAWQHFDVGLSDWPDVKESALLQDAFGSDSEFQHWSRIFDQVYQGKIDTWDFSWAYAFWKNKGLSILPEVNLVTNIGFGNSATHTIDPSSKLANLPAQGIGKLNHPSKIAPNIKADQFTWENIIAPPPATIASKKQPKWYRKLFSRTPSEPTNAAS